MAKKTRNRFQSKKFGRPEKLTPEITLRIANALRMGTVVELAAFFGGIRRSTFYAWKKRGESEDSGKYRDFSDTIAQAFAEAEVRFTMIIFEAAKTDWRAALCLLERRYSERWGG